MAKLPAGMKPGIKNPIAKPSIGIKPLAGPKKAPGNPGQPPMMNPIMGPGTPGALSGLSVPGAKPLAQPAPKAPGVVKTSLPARGLKKRLP